MVSQEKKAPQMQGPAPTNWTSINVSQTIVYEIKEYSSNNLY